MTRTWNSPESRSEPFLGDLNCLCIWARDVYDTMTANDDDIMRYLSDLCSLFFLEPMRHVHEAEFQHVPLMMSWCSSSHLPLMRASAVSNFDPTMRCWRDQCHLSMIWVADSDMLAAELEVLDCDHFRLASGVPFAIIWAKSCPFLMLTTVLPHSAWLLWHPRRPPWDLNWSKGWRWSLKQSTMHWIRVPWGLDATHHFWIWAVPKEEGIDQWLTSPWRVAPADASWCWAGSPQRSEDWLTHLYMLIHEVWRTSIVVKELCANWPNHDWLEELMKEELAEVNLTIIIIIIIILIERHHDVIDSRSEAWCPWRVFGNIAHDTWHYDVFTSSYT